MGTVACREPRRRLERCVNIREAEILEYARHLPQEDAADVIGRVKFGRSWKSLAREGESERQAAYRVGALIDRVESPRFRFVAQNCGNWPRLMRLVSQMAILFGRGQEDVASELGVSHSQVRKAESMIEGALAHERSRR